MFDSDTLTRHTKTCNDSVLTGSTKCTIIICFIKETINNLLAPSPPSSIHHVPSIIISTHSHGHRVEQIAIETIPKHPLHPASTTTNWGICRGRRFRPVEPRLEPRAITLLSRSGGETLQTSYACCGWLAVEREVR